MTEGASPSFYYVADADATVNFVDVVVRDLAARVVVGADEGVADYVTGLPIVARLDRCGYEHVAWTNRGEAFFPELGAAPFDVTVPEYDGEAPCRKQSLRDAAAPRGGRVDAAERWHRRRGEVDVTSATPWAPRQNSGGSRAARRSTFGTGEAGVYGPDCPKLCQNQPSPAAWLISAQVLSRIRMSSCRRPRRYCARAASPCRRPPATRKGGARARC